MPLGNREDFGPEKYAGILYGAVPVSVPPAPAERFVQNAQALGYDFVCLPLAHNVVDQQKADVANGTHGPSRTKRAIPHDGSVLPPMTPSTHLHTMISGSVSNRIVGLATETADCKQLLMELEWAAHLTCQACIVTIHESMPVPLLAQTLSTFLHGSGANTSTWVRLPANGLTSSTSLWNAWNEIRFHCEHHRNLGLVLDAASWPDDRFPLGDKASEDVMGALRHRLMGEPVKAVIISSSFPDGDKVCQEAFRRGLQVIVHADEDTGPEDLRAMHMLLSHVLHSQPMLSEEAILEMPYRDFLQAPLQPLQDNLESQTYETFERDSPKYIAYEEAVFQALKAHRIGASSPMSMNETYSPEKNPVEPACVDVCVVGAGRGPLVSAVLRASVRAEQPVRVVAVEKNRNAIVHVMARARSEGWDMEGQHVKIVHADMRRWNPKNDDNSPYLADILVSELLGSFGDNELSPECLDGAQRFLKPGGCSIPAKYTSYLSPITASRAWSEVAARDAAITIGSIKNLETPFVVRLHDHRRIGDNEGHKDGGHPIFEFSHPVPDSTLSASTTTATNPDHNDREVCDVTFYNSCAYPVICHGFAGYFTAVLWGDVKLSIHPRDHTKDMYSWFPIFFPVRTPFTVKSGEAIVMSMFRRSNSTKVWYEWAVQSPVALPVHNPGGRSYHVGL